MVKTPPRRKKPKQQPRAVPPRAVPRPAPKAQSADEVFSGLLQKLGTSEDEPTPAAIRLDNIEPDPDQPRREFGEAELAELAATIQDLGVLQPIVVRPHPNGRGGRYMLVMGERRWRAAAVAGLTAIPAVVQTGAKRRRAQLVENLQRQDLGALEIARALRVIVGEAESEGESQASVARALGKDRAYVTRYLRLLKLLPELLELLEKKRCSDMQVLLALDDFVREEPARQGRLRAFLKQNPDFALSRGNLPSIQAAIGGTAAKPKGTGRLAVQPAVEHLLSVTGVRASVTRGKTELRIQCKSAEELAKVEAWLTGSSALDELAN